MLEFHYDTRTLHIQDITEREASRVTLSDTVTPAVTQLGTVALPPVTFPAQETSLSLSLPPSLYPHPGESQLPCSPDGDKLAALTVAGGARGREVQGGLGPLQARLPPVRDGLKLHGVAAVRLQSVQEHGIPGLRRRQEARSPLGVCPARPLRPRARRPLEKHGHRHPMEASLPKAAPSLPPERLKMRFYSASKHIAQKGRTSFWEMVPYRITGSSPIPQE